MVSMRFGKLESVAESSGSSLVALPANEFFDDECILNNALRFSR